MMNGSSPPSTAYDGDDTVQDNKCVKTRVANTTESMFTATIPFSLVDSIGFKGKC